MDKFPPLVETGLAAFAVDLSADGGSVHLQIGSGAYEHHFFLSPAAFLTLCRDGIPIVEQARETRQRAGVA